MPKIIPHRVKTIREGLDKPLADISRKAGLSERNLQRIESDPTDKRSVNDNTLKRLASALRVAAEVLTGELPLPDNLTARGNYTSQRSDNPNPPREEVFETRLVKLDDKFVIVEFSDAHPTGQVIARDIVDEAAGLRLSSAAELRSKLRELYPMLTHPDGFFEGFLEAIAMPNSLDLPWEANPDELFDFYVTGLGRLLSATPTRIPLMGPEPKKFVLPGWDLPVQAAVEDERSKTDYPSDSTFVSTETKP
jgi:transcriptional regulator with XRE-family HTH domain